MNNTVLTENESVAIILLIEKLIKDYSTEYCMLPEQALLENEIFYNLYVKLGGTLYLSVKRAG